MAAPAIQTEPKAIVYPDSDGKPMADNTKQYRWITMITGGLDILFRDDPNVFVAGDLLWYPVEGDPLTRVAPDAMVVFGRPKGDRGSYQQWREDSIAPQVVFEILSPGNRLREMGQKFDFYDRFEVEEYYIYDPDTLDFSGWQRIDDRLRVIEQISGWVSPRLGIRFEAREGSELEIYYPDGRRFSTIVKLDEERRHAEERAAESETRATQAEARADQVEQERDSIAADRERLAARLRELGIESEG